MLSRISIPGIRQSGGNGSAYPPDVAGDGIDHDARDPKNVGYRPCVPVLRNGDGHRAVAVLGEGYGPRLGADGYRKWSHSNLYPIDMYGSPRWLGIDRHQVRPDGLTNACGMRDGGASGPGAKNRRDDCNKRNGTSHRSPPLLH